MMILPVIDRITPLGVDQKVKTLSDESVMTQQGVILNHFRIEGPKKKEDENRYQVIARSRNNAKKYGHNPFVFFLDSDVQLINPYSVRILYDRLIQNPKQAALGIVYQQGVEPNENGYCDHVAMGAVLWRRHILERLTFMSVAGKCECLCACDSIRDMGYDINYIDKNILTALHI